MFTRLPPLPRLRLAAACMAAMPALAVAAAPEVQEIIVVTPVPGSNMAKDLLPGNVQIAGNEDLDRSHASDVTAYMNRYLGSVHINEMQSNPFQPDINYRGFTASPLLGTAQGMSVYLDGVRLNQPFGDVLSWDLIPRRAIDTISLMPGSNPLFGLNTLGGALNVSTQSGDSDPGTAVEAVGGEFGRRALEYSNGGKSGDWHWYVTGNRFHDNGWRMDSPSEVRQLFGKLGVDGERGKLAVEAAIANNELHGNGLQEMRLLAADRTSVYTLPDITNNFGTLVNVIGSQELASGLKLSGNAWWRTIQTATVNGDLNTDSLDQAAYQPNAAERAALTAAGYSGFPVAGESAANTPFPKWRCIAQALLNDEPGEKCNGLINSGNTHQYDRGLNLQLESNATLAGFANLAIAGLSYDSNDVNFVQNAELGYLDATRRVVGIGAIADGVHAGNINGDAFDSRVNLRADSTTWSLFLTDTIALDKDTHLTLSGRYNHAQVRTRDNIHPGGGTGSLDGDNVFSRFNPAVGLTYRFTPAITGYAGVNQGNRAPSAIELGCADPLTPCKLPNSMAGDPPLKQVVATTVELGLRGSGALHWNAGVYRTDSRDDILFVADNAAGYGYFRNFGETRRQGFEAGVATELAGVQWSANYSYINAIYRSAETVNGGSNSSNDQARAGFPGVDGNIVITPGMRLPLVPRELLKLNAQWPVTSDVTLNADLVAVASSIARGNENNAHVADGVYYLGPGHSPGYTVLNLGGDWQLRKHFSLFAQLNNVFDRDYTTAAQLSPTGLTASGNYIARPFAANANGERPVVHSTFFSPGAPRTFWLGVRYRFGV